MKVSSILVIIAICAVLLWRLIADPLIVGSVLTVVILFVWSTVKASMFMGKPASKFLRFIVSILYIGFWGSVVYFIIHYIVILYRG